MEKSERLTYIDILKGLGIVSVVYLHCCLEEDLFLKYITSFHMPLFFVISGYCYNHEHYKKFQDIFLKKFKGLMIAFLFYGKLVGLPLEILRQTVLGIEVSMDTVIEFILYWSAVGTWFLYTLFCVYMLEWCIFKISSKKEAYSIYKIIFLNILVLVFGLFLSTRENLSLELIELIRLLVGTFFFFVGWFYKTKVEEKISFLNDKVYIFMLFFVLGILVSMINKRVYYFSVQFGNVMLFLISALLSIFSWFYIIEYFATKHNIQNNIFIKIIKFLGENTLIILCIHQIFINVVRVFERMIVNITFPYVISTILTLLACGLSILIINRCFSWTIGKWK